MVISVMSLVSLVSKIQTEKRKDLVFLSLEFPQSVS